VTTLVLVRHAEPVAEARGRCYGTLDLELSGAGHAQARALAARLDAPDAIVSSPRLRAVQTAQPLAELRGLPIEIDERLRELDFGDFEGRTYDEIERSEPERFRAWMTSPTTVQFPNGESYADLRARAAAALDDIRSRHAHALVVTHGGVIRAGLAAWLELPDRAVFRLGQRHCGVTIVDWFGDEPVVRVLNAG
jgi:alpha-ribazole phosphatase/probable phosphoglycerate mutase